MVSTRIIPLLLLSSVTVSESYLLEEDGDRSRNVRVRALQSSPTEGSAAGIADLGSLQDIEDRVSGIDSIFLQDIEDRISGIDSIFGPVGPVLPDFSDLQDRFSGGGGGLGVPISTPPPSMAATVVVTPTPKPTVANVVTPSPTQAIATTNPTEEATSDRDFVFSNGNGVQFSDGKTLTFGGLFEFFPCIAYEDQSVQSKLSNSRGDMVCRFNECDGCCRVFDFYLKCDIDNNYPSAQCVCNENTFIQST